MQSPANYRTLKGLLRATERLLRRKHRSVSDAWWLCNAAHAAEQLNGAAEFAALRDKYVVTRLQDLQGGHAVFGHPLPKRDYHVGDNVPGVGRVTDAVVLPNGTKQFCIQGEWFHERCFSKA